VDEHPRPTSNKATLDAGNNPKSFLRAQSAAMLAFHPIPFQVAGGAIDQIFPQRDRLARWQGKESVAKKTEDMPRE